MKQPGDHLWIVVVFAGVLLLLASMLVHAEDLTLRAAFRDPAGVTGTIDFTVELESSSTSAETPMPGASSVPEPSTLALVGLGVMGLAIVRKTVTRR